MKKTSPKDVEGLGQEHNKREVGRSFPLSWQPGPKQLKLVQLHPPLCPFLVTRPQTPSQKAVRLLDHLYEKQQEGHRRTFSLWLFCLYVSENGLIQAQPQTPFVPKSGCAVDQAPVLGGDVCATGRVDHRGLSKRDLTSAAGPGPCLFGP